ncbi:hypothetical protein Poli38472_001815 [Pythium oligandrum]|uniref:Uncharacterized protein n=1 Tax=Pythium oligandrum TaxID=41045 RepID=A0A8K1FQQ1_PYTOL|nr:hypothetical protein Poli38472_001815 [Pythium oligandrum]|eukprot:TMW69659.1 hypothetical protein Poli38472_001815 [Pythium oligandrum]
MATPASPSRILVLGADAQVTHAILKRLIALSTSEPSGDDAGPVDVLPLTLKTKYYEADVEFHVHDVEANEIVTALQHDAEEYEALLWVVDATIDRSFVEVQHFVEKSLEELSFDVSLLIGHGADKASKAQVEKMEGWCQENGFEFIPVDETAVEAAAKAAEGLADEKQGVDRVLEALECNMWRSMEMLPPPPRANAQLTKVKEELATQEAEAGEDKATVSPPPAPAASPDTPSTPAPTEASATTTTSAPPVSDADRLQASLAALGLAGEGMDDDPDLAAFGNLLSQVRRIRQTGQNLSDQERRQQAEQVAMQLWNLLGADESDDDEGKDSD